MCSVDKELYDVLNEVDRKLKSMTTVQRAEIVIRQFCKLENPDEKITDAFNDWLMQNAEAVLQTDALELYFDKLAAPQISAYEAAAGSGKVISMYGTLNGQPKKAQEVI